MSLVWKNKRVTITGGAGFLGSNLAVRLLHEGAQVRAVDNFERGRREFLAPILDDIELLELDLRDTGSAKLAVRDTDVLFHLASKVGGINVYVEKPGTVLRSNLLIDQNIFGAAVSETVSSIFYATSGHVYPEDLQQTPDAPAIREDQAYPAAPGLSYGWGKLIGEQSLLAFAQEFDWLRVSMARIVGAYGYNQDIALATGSVIPVFCHRAAVWPAGAPFRIWGTGTETRSYCYVGDIIEGFLRSVEAQEKHSVVGPFNLGAEGRVTIRDIAETIVELSGKDIPLEFDTSATTTIWGQAVDCSLAREILNEWKPKISFRDGLQRTYQHVVERVTATS